MYLKRNFSLQEVLVWLTKLQEELEDDFNEERVREFIWNTLKNGQVEINDFLIENVIILDYTNLFLCVLRIIISTYRSNIYFSFVISKHLN